jgi:uncharacterized protein (DUF2141 family)
VTSTTSTSGTLTVTGSITAALQTDEKGQVSADGGTTRVDATTTGTTWTATFNNVNDGSYAVQAEVVNNAGGFSTAATQTVTVDNTAPAEAITISATVTPAAGEQGSGSTVSSLSGATISGTVSPALASATTGAVSAEQLQISIDGGSTWQAVTTVNAASGAWSYVVPTGTYSNASYAVQARVADLAGNVTAASDMPSLTVPVKPPPNLFSAVTLAMDPSTDDGDSNTDGITGNVSPLFDGTVTTTNPGVQADMQAGKVAATLFIDTNGNGLPDAGEQILSSNVPVSSAGAFSSNVGSLLPGRTYTITAAVSDDGIYGTASGTTIAQIVGKDGGEIDPEKTPADIVYTGSTSPIYQGLGYSMSAVGDFNGDGYTDYIVSAPSNHIAVSGNTAGTEGKSYMFLLYGSDTGLPNLTSLIDSTGKSQIPATTGFMISSSNTLDRGFQGMTVTDIGDINGDGLSDVAIASNMNDSVYVLYGSNSGYGTIDLANLTLSQGFRVYTTASATPNLANTSAVSGSYLGVSATGADFNGDGYSDLVVGNLYNGSNLGWTYVIYGGPNMGNVYINNSGSNPTTLTGATYGATVFQSGTATTATAGLGTNMSAVGDVNGDGYTDYVVTAPGGGGVSSTLAGTAYLLYGGPGSLLANPGGGATTNLLFDTSLTGLTAAQGISITAGGSNEHLGGQALSAFGNGQNADAYYAQYHSVTSLGNINGSGNNYIAIGSPGAINPLPATGEGAGAVYVINSGANLSNITLPTWSSGGWTNTQSLVANGGFVIYSSTFAAAANGTLKGASDLGYAVKSVGDVNGDGIADFMIGAPASNDGAGSVFLVFGEVGGFPGASTGVVDLDSLVSAGVGHDFGVAGTAIRYQGNITNTNLSIGGTNTGTDVAGGDFRGTGIDSYVFSSWGYSTVSTNVAGAQVGRIYANGGTPEFLTQPYFNADNQIYYADTQGTGYQTIVNGVDIFVTGIGNNDWVHGIGADTTGTTALTVQHDSVNGGAGSNYIGIVSTNFTNVNGGGGWNTLVFENVGTSGMTVDLSKVGLRVQNFQEFDLNNQLNNLSTDPRTTFTGAAENNTLALRLSDVLNISQSLGSNGYTGPNGQHQITILGDGTSTVQLLTAAGTPTNSANGAGWTQTGSQTIGGIQFDQYHNSAVAATNTAADLLIQHGVVVV